MSNQRVRSILRRLDRLVRSQPPTFVCQEIQTPPGATDDQIAEAIAEAWQARVAANPELGDGRPVALLNVVFLDCEEEHHHVIEPDSPAESETP